MYITKYNFREDIAKLGNLNCEVRRDVLEKVNIPTEPEGRQKLAPEREKEST